MSANKIQHKSLYFLTVSLTIMGIAFSYYYRDPIFLNRFGAAIIVLGVLFGASSYKIDRLAAYDRMHTLRMALLQHNINERKYEDEMGVPKDLREPEIGIDRGKIDRMKGDAVGRLLKSEAYIVCIGTLLNGWGDFLLRNLFHD